MKHYLEMVYKTLLNKLRMYFKSKLKAMLEQKSTFVEHAMISSKALPSYFILVHEVAKSEKLHIIAEMHILATAIDMMSIELQFEHMCYEI